MNEFLPVKVDASPTLVQPVQYPDPGSASQTATKRFFSFLWRYWWVPLLSLLIAVGGGVGLLWFAPPVFVSKAKMWETEKMRLLPDGGGFTEDLQNYIGTQIELLRSDKLKDLAVAQLRGEGKAPPVDAHGKPRKVRLRLAQAPKTTVLEAEAFSSDPGYAQAFLNALMDQYLEYKKTVRKSVSGDTLASISDQLLRLEAELKASQDALTAFERTNNLAILEEEGRIAGGHLAKLRTQLSDIKLQEQLLEATAMERSEAQKSNAASVLLAPLPGTASSSSAFQAERQTAVKDLQLLQMQREELSRYLRPKHPKIVKLDSDIERAQKLLEMYRRQSQDEINSSRQALKMSFDSVSGSIKEWEEKVVESNRRISEAEQLKLNVARTQTLCDRLSLLLQNVDVSRSVDRETLTILERASVPERYYLRDLLVLAVAIAVGLCVGIAMVFIIEARDDRFSSVQDIDEKFGESVVGQLPEIRQLARNGPIALVQSENQQDMFAESCRNLRSALLFLPNQGNRPRVILITSALPNEGKSTIATNLAKALALGGARVLLVDADLRRGQLHKVLGLKAGPGLTDMLLSREPAKNFVQTDSVPNLSFISRGTVPQNPGDLLLRPELNQALTAWRAEFDYVLIDSCPVFAADDVTTLAHKADGTLLVVRRRFVGARVVSDALTLLIRRQARVLGLVFNRADTSTGSYHYYTYGEYHLSGKK